jgi:hypothetical protein
MARPTLQGRRRELTSIPASQATVRPLPVDLTSNLEENGQANQVGKEER